MNQEEYVNKFFEIAKKMGYEIETCKSGTCAGERQIDFGNKKLHAGHVRLLYPVAKDKGVDITNVDFEKIVPGRPCASAPFRKINSEIWSK
jgi:hypothetical protein